MTASDTVSLEIAYAALNHEVLELSCSHAKRFPERRDLSTQAALELAEALTPRVAALYSAIAALRTVAEAQLKEEGR